MELFLLTYVFLRIKHVVSLVSKCLYPLSPLVVSALFCNTRRLYFFIALAIFSTRALLLFLWCYAVNPGVAIDHGFLVYFYSVNDFEGVTLQPCHLNASLCLASHLCYCLLSLLSTL